MKDGLDIEEIYRKREGNMPAKGKNGVRYERVGQALTSFGCMPCSENLIGKMVKVTIPVDVNSYKELRDREFRIKEYTHCNGCTNHCAGKVVFIEEYGGQDPGFRNDGKPGFCLTWDTIRALVVIPEKEIPAYTKRLIRMGE